jgi:hypothetical protein
MYLLGYERETKEENKNSHRLYTGHIWSTRVAYNGRGDGEESTKTTKDIFWPSKTTASVAQNVRLFQCTNNFSIKKILF